MTQEEKTYQSALSSLLWSHWGDSAGARFEFGQGSDLGLALRNPAEILELRDSSPWVAGEPTDDTDMAFAILSAHADNIADPEIDVVQCVLHRFLMWLGGRPKDIGTLTRKSLQNAIGHNLEGGRLAWHESNKNAAGNGGLMRCHPTALLAPEYDVMARHTIAICQLTHYDPRCVVSALFHNSVIWHIIHRGASGVNAFQESIVATQYYDQYMCSSYCEGEWKSAITGLLQYANIGHEVAVNGGTLPSSGFTFDGIAHSSFAANSAARFSPEQALAFSIAHGDDADTNGAIAGAVIGAMTGAAPIISKRLLLADQMRNKLNRCFDKS